MLVTVFVVLLTYFLIIFVGFRLFVPFMGFGPLTLPEHIPADIKASIGQLETKAFNQQSYLHLVFDFIMQKNYKQWNHTRFKAATQLPRMFVKDLGEIWTTNKFVYCTGINYLSFVMLAGSKYFKPQDIRTRHTFVNMIIHQYLQVKIGDTWVDFDPAGTGIRSKPLGTHLSFFG